jgi:hypothetical protein
MYYKLLVCMQICLLFSLTPVCKPLAEAVEDGTMFGFCGYYSKVKVLQLASCKLSQHYTY